MVWVRITDAFDDDHRIATIGPSGAGLLVMLLCYSNRTLSDGWISENTMRQKAATLPDADQIITAMVRTGVLRRMSRDDCAGFQIHEDFVSAQLSSEEVKKNRAEWRKRTARMRDQMKKRRRKSTFRVV
jgi:hypothetical protein